MTGHSFSYYLVIFQEVGYENKDLSQLMPPTQFDQMLQTNDITIHNIPTSSENEVQVQVCIYLLQCANLLFFSIICIYLCLNFRLPQEQLAFLLE